MVLFMHPAKSAGRNEMPFSTDTRVVPSNTVLDRGSAPVHPREGKIRGEGLPVRSDAAYPYYSFVQSMNE